jgi:hypothetical protein
MSGGILGVGILLYVLTSLRGYSYIALVSIVLLMHLFISIATVQVQVSAASLLASHTLQSRTGSANALCHSDGKGKDTCRLPSWMRPDQIRLCRDDAYFTSQISGTALTIESGTGHLIDGDPMAEIPRQNGTRG